MTSMLFNGCIVMYNGNTTTTHRNTHTHTHLVDAHTSTLIITHTHTHTHTHTPFLQVHCLCTLCISQTYPHPGCCVCSQSRFMLYIKYKDHYSLPPPPCDYIVQIIRLVSMHSYAVPLFPVQSFPQALSIYA